MMSIASYKCWGTNKRVAMRMHSFCGGFMNQGGHQTKRPICSRTLRPKAAVRTVELLQDLVAPTNRGLSTSKQTKDSILACIDQLLEKAGSDSCNTSPSSLSATWRLLWTTEKETLFILQRAGLFGTKAGEVYQVSTR